MAVRSERVGSEVPGLAAALGGPRPDRRAGRPRLVRPAEGGRGAAQVSPPVKECLPALVELLRDRDYNIRQSAGQALEKVGRRAGEVAPALRGLLKERDPFVRVLAARVLGRTGPEGEAPGAGGAPRGARRRRSRPPGSRRPKASGTSATARRPSPCSSPRSAPATTYGVNNQASQILQRMGPADKKSVPLLVEALKDEQPERPQPDPANPPAHRARRPRRGPGPDRDAQGEGQQRPLPGPPGAPAARPAAQGGRPGPPRRDQGRATRTSEGQVVQLLGQLGAESKAAIPALAEMLKDPNQSDPAPGDPGLAAGRRPGPRSGGAGPDRGAEGQGPERPLAGRAGARATRRGGGRVAVPVDGRDAEGPAPRQPHPGDPGPRPARPRGEGRRARAWSRHSATRTTASARRPRRPSVRSARRR